MTLRGTPDHAPDHAPAPEAAALVARALRGEAAAWERLVEQYARLVYAVGVRHGLTPPEVEDMAQETFLALAQALHTLEEAERLPGWLLTTARRLCWRAVQRRRREAPGEASDLMEEFAPAPGTGPAAPGTGSAAPGTGPAAPGTGSRPLFATLPSMDELAAEWERQELLARGLARLSDRCRTLLTLLFLEADEPSYAEIAARTGIAKGSIGPTRSRCLAQLRALLEAEP